MNPDDKARAKYQPIADKILKLIEKHETHERAMILAFVCADCQLKDSRFNTCMAEVFTELYSKVSKTASPGARQFPCPFCGLTIIDEPATHSISHAAPQCTGFEKVAARYGQADTEMTIYNLASIPPRGKGSA